MVFSYFFFKREVKLMDGVNMKTKLYHYQRQAMSWMHWFEREVEKIEIKYSAVMPWIGSGCEFLFDFSLIVEKKCEQVFSPEDVKEQDTFVAKAKGGILADESKIPSSSYIFFTYF